MVKGLDNGGMKNYTSETIRQPQHLISELFLDTQYKKATSFPDSLFYHSSTALFLYLCLALYRSWSWFNLGNRDTGRYKSHVITCLLGLTRQVRTLLERLLVRTLGQEIRLFYFCFLREEPALLLSLSSDGIRSTKIM